MLHLATVLQNRRTSAGPSDDPRHSADACLSVVLSVPCRQLCLHSGFGATVSARLLPVHGSLQAPIVQPAKSQATQIIGKYRLAELMAQGGAGRVYRCVHTGTGHLAALKLPLGESVFEREALRREIVLLQRLSQLEDSSIVRLLDYGAEAGTPWYAMEYIQGQHLASFREGLWAGLHGTGLGGASEPASTLTQPSSGMSEASSAVAPGVTRPLERPEWDSGEMVGSVDGNGYPLQPQAAAGRLNDVLRIGACLADALDLIHSEGVVHGDLTPRNVIIRASTGTPVLVDFGTSFLTFRGGLGRELMHVVGRPQGTPAYMAPEAIAGRTLDARCDLYALGCILFELLAGRRVFLGPDAAAVTRQHRLTQPTRLAAVVIGAPPAVDDLIARLLAKDPTDRIGRAREVAAILRFAMGEAPGTSERVPDRNPLLFRSRLHDREAVLESVCGFLPVRPDARGGIVILHGESGVGKTRLVNEVASRARASGVRVVSGQCGETGAEMASGMRVMAALQPFASVLEEVADRWVVSDENGWRRKFAEHVAVLEPYAPASLGSIAPVQAPESLSPELARRRVLRCLSELLAALAEEQPLLLVLDDLQWADELTLEFLRERGPQLGSTKVLLLVTYRREQASEELTSLCDCALVDHGLERMSESGLHNAAKDMLGARVVPEGLSQFLVRNSEGNPFFATEYLRAALGRGLLRYRGNGEWEFDASGGIELPRSLGALFELRLASLSSKATSLLQFAAVLGRDFELGLLQALPSHDGTFDEEALEELVSAELLEWVGPRRYRFVHSKLREAQAAALSPELRRRLHRSVALRLEDLASHQRDEDALAEALGIHWAEAGEPEQALTHLERAAIAARERFATARAVELYREAIHQCRQLQQHAPARFRRRLASLEEGLGDALILLAQHGEARAAFERALALTHTEEHLQRARVLRKNASSYWLLHDYEKAGELLDFAERVLGVPDSEQLEDNRERIEILVGRLEVLYFSGRVGDQMQQLVDELEPLVTQYGSAVQRHLLYAAAFSCLNAQNRFAHDEAVVQMARRTLPNNVGPLPLNLVAQASFIMGFALMTGSREQCKMALQWFQDAERTAERAGDATLLSRILVYQTLALVRIEDVESTHRLAKRVMFAAESAQLPPYVAIAEAFECWALWRKDRAQAARTHARKATEVWRLHAHPFPFKWVCLLPLLDLQLGEECMDGARDTIEQLLVPSQQALPVLLDEALREVLAAFDSGADREARDRATYALSVARSLGYC